MDSINRNQQEQNHEDLSGGGAIAKLKEIVDGADVCFFRTSPLPGGSHGARPMSVRKVTDDGTLWFLSPSDSHKNLEIASDPVVNLYFQGSTHSDFLYLEGHATVLTEKEIIKDLWHPLIKTWFTEGVDDPRITVIKVVPRGGYYWDTKHGNFVAGIKVLIGAMTGKTMDDSIEGNLRV